MTFTDRREAGRRLARALEGRVDGPAVVLGLPRGGVPVAAEVAAALGAPLDVIGVRKVGAPGHPELGVGAVAEGGGLVLDERTLGHLGIGPESVAATIEAERREVARRVERYRGARGLPDLEGRTVVVVDDGLATGVTARAAVRAVRNQGATRVVLAVPVCSAAGRDELAEEVDEVVCVLTPAHFGAVGRWYVHFDQTSDEEVLEALAGSRATDAGTP
jgi:predicted phosphoribosyltransferase